ncbi:MAG: 3D domain-containing protein [Bacillota bacterium]
MEDGINVRQKPAATGLRNFSWIVVGLLVVSFAITGYAWVRKDVNLVVGEETKRIVTFAESVGQLLVDEGIRLEVHDQVEPAVTAPLKKGMTIIVKKSFPLTVRVDNSTLELETVLKTVREILHELEIELGPEDRVNYPLGEMIRSETEIVVTRVKTEIVREDEEMPFRVVRQQEDSLERGFSKVVQKGERGVQENTFLVTYEDGQETKKELVSKRIIKYPVTEEVRVGALQVVSRGGTDYHFREAKKVEATAYTHTGNRTKTGTWPQVGTIAVDPKVIPLGTKLYVEGYGVGKAEDIGGAIKGNRIDVFLDTEKECVIWGRKNLKVYILE